MNLRCFLMLIIKKRRVKEYKNRRHFLKQQKLYVHLKDEKKAFYKRIHLPKSLELICGKIKMVI